MRGKSLSLRDAFTLVELLVVIAIIGVLVALLLPAVQVARESARRTSCQNNLKQLGLAVQVHNDVQKYFPPSRTHGDGWGGTWAVYILPYMEQDNVYKVWDIQRLYYDQPDAARQVTIKSFFCPSRRTGGLSVNERNNRPGALADYAAVEGNGRQADLPTSLGPLVTAQNYVFTGSGSAQRLVQWSHVVRMAMITDGTSNTALIGEKHVPIGQFGRSPWDTSVFNSDPVAGPVYRQLGREWSTEQQPSQRGVSQDIARDLPLVTDPKLTNTAAPIHSDWRFGSAHPSGSQFVMCDGSVRFTPANINIMILTWLAIRNDDQLLGDF